MTRNEIIKDMVTSEELKWFVDNYGKSESYCIDTVEKVIFDSSTSSVKELIRGCKELLKVDKPDLLVHCNYFMYASDKGMRVFDTAEMISKWIKRGVKYVNKK